MDANITELQSHVTPLGWYKGLSYSSRTRNGTVAGAFVVAVTWFLSAYVEHRATVSDVLVRTYHIILVGRRCFSFRSRMPPAWPHVFSFLFLYPDIRTASAFVFWCLSDPPAWPQELEFMCGGECSY